MAKTVHPSESGNLDKDNPQSGLTELEWRRMTEGLFPEDEGRESIKTDPDNNWLSGLGISPSVDLQVINMKKKLAEERDALGEPESHPLAKGFYGDPVAKPVPEGTHVYIEEQVPFGPEEFEKAAEILNKADRYKRAERLQNKSNSRLYELGRIHANVLVIMAKNHPTPMTEMYFQGFDDRIDEILATGEQKAEAADEEE